MELRFREHSTISLRSEKGSCISIGQSDVTDIVRVFMPFFPGQDNRSWVLRQEGLYQYNRSLL
jgi:hypothetical protein